MNNFLRPSRPRSHNRVAAVLAHTVKYAFKGRARLAADAGVSRSSLTRLMSGRTRPTQQVINRLIRILEKELKRRIDVQDLWSEDGSYPTPFICTVTGCPGCLPPQFYSPKTTLRTAYANTKPGEWTGDNQESLPSEWQMMEEVR